ncbi:hypothetical protein ACIQJ4_35530 [Streptomyces filamentosus]|uniref:hypothetical protein n=1 Tax=Streptomyces filamentosus TaxID=67294 RepID=UPI00381E7349
MDTSLRHARGGPGRHHGQVTQPVDRLLATAVGFFSKRNRTGNHVIVDDLFNAIQQCRAYARRRKAPQAELEF